MEVSKKHADQLQFGPFELNLDERELRKHRRRLKLGPQPLKVLAALASRPGEVVTREELQKVVWGDGTFVDFEQGLNFCIRQIRAVLDDDPDAPTFIETVPRRGYRFLASVTRSANADTRQQENASKASDPELNGDNPVDQAAVLRSINNRRSSLRLGLLWGFGVLVLVVGIFATLEFLPRVQRPVIVQRQLTTNSSEAAVASGAISPDGKYLAYWDMRGIHLMLVATREVRTIPLPPELRDASAWWNVRSWYPDSSRFLANAIIGQRSSIWIISALGGVPTKLRDDAWAWSVSPDGKRIAFANVKKVVLSSIWSPEVASSELWTMSADGGDARKLFAIDKDPFATVEEATWSGDGARIAYEVAHRDEAALRYGEVELESRKSDGQHPRKLFAAPDIGGLVWLPDGRIVFTRTDPFTHVSDLLQLHLSASGGTSGEPKSLINWVGASVDGMSTTADGTLLAFHKWLPESSIYTGEFNTGDKALHDATHLTLSEGRNLPMAFTNDGVVLFSSTRNGHISLMKQAVGESDPNSQLLVQGRDGAEALGGELTPDGAWVIYKECAAPCAQESRKRLMRVPVAGGAPQFILSALLYSNVVRCARYPVQLCAFLERSSDRTITFVSFDPFKGRGPELGKVSVRSDGFYDWSLSPDSKSAAYLEEGDDTIHVVHFPSQAVSDVHVHGWRNLSSIDDTPDGKAWLVSSVSSGSGTLLYVDSTGRAHLVWQPQSNVGWGILSPDGKRLAVLAQSNSGNMWLLEGFAK